MKTKIGFAAAVICLLLVTLACGTGYRTTYKKSGNSGTIRVRMKEADGTDSTNLEINEDYFREDVTVQAVLSVETGQCQASLTGEDGTGMVLSASSGSPGRSTAEIITDSFGEIDLETTCQGAQNLDLQLDFKK